MIFAHPSALLLLPLLPIAIWAWLRRPLPALMTPALGTLARLPGRRGIVSRWGDALLRGIVLALLVLALAGPRWPEPGARIVTEGIALEVILDVSGSMAEKDAIWAGAPVTRLEAAKRACRLLIEGGAGPEGESLPGRPEDQVGLVTFAHWPTSAAPLTLDHAAVLNVLDRQQPQRRPDLSQTNIGDAVAWGLHRLEGASPRRRAMVLITDGAQNVPPPALTQSQSAALAAARSVPVYVLDCGPEDKSGAQTDAGRREREDSRRALGSLASATGGRYFPASDIGALLAACADVDRLERATISSFRYEHYREAYPWLGIAALGIWFAAATLNQTGWRRVPA